MGRGEPLDRDEIKFICEHLMLGAGDEQIQRALGKDGRSIRDIRTVRNIRRVFEVSREVLRERFERMRDMPDGLSNEDIERTVEIVEKMSQGLRPVYDKKTGKITYEAWLEF
jgi:hypothetical protein